MARYPLAVLALAVCVQSWPQISFDDGLVEVARSLPEIPFTTKRGERTPRHLDLPAIEDDDALVATLPIPVSWKRRQLQPRRLLPVDDELDAPRITLPIPVHQDGWKWAAEPQAKAGARQVPRQVPGALSLPVFHSTKPGLFKRAVEVELANRSDVAYYAQLNIGTPPQEVFVQVDTGSFELWVNPDCTTLGDGDRRFCEAVGKYDAGASTTASDFTGSKLLRYGIGEANITYVQDSIGLPGSAVMSGVQFGVATASEDQFAGILGIGYGQGISTRYPNFVDNLAAQGVTKVRAFSLAMGSKEDQEGVLVFGGVDTAKFGGPLARLPVIPAAQSPDGVPRYWVQMNGIDLTPPSGRTRPYASSEMPVFLDSGATLTLLPKGLADSIALDFGANGVDSSGFYNVDCKLADMPGTVNFRFPGITINVPYKEIIRELRTTPPRCYLGIVPNEDFVLLGDTFLRSAYVVFDPESHIVYMATYSNCGTRVMAIDQVSMLPTLTGDCAVTNNAAVVPDADVNVGGDANTNSATGTNSDPQGGGSSPPAAEGIDSGVSETCVSWWTGLLAVAAVMCLL